MSEPKQHTFILLLFFVLWILVSKAFVSETTKFHVPINQVSSSTSSSVLPMSFVENNEKEKIYNSKKVKRERNSRSAEQKRKLNFVTTDKRSKSNTHDPFTQNVSNHTIKKGKQDDEVSRRTMLQGAIFSGAGLLLRFKGQNDNGVKTKTSDYQKMITFETTDLFDTMPSKGRKYYPPLIPPLFNRPTYRYNLGRNTWALEQPMVIGGIREIIRSIVVRMNDGSLWVLSPQWPTGEFCALLDELGPVAHVVLPTNAWEHAAPMKAFMKLYPEASVWISPGQRGPFGTCGTDAENNDSSKYCNDMPYHVDGILPITTQPFESAPSLTKNTTLPPWSNEFEVRTMYTKDVVSEAAFYHKPSKSLMITDAVIMYDVQEQKILDTLLRFKPPSSLLALLNGPLKEPSLRRIPLLQALIDTRSPDTFRNWFQDLIDIGNFDRVLTLHGVSPIKATASTKLPKVLQSFLNDDNNNLSCSNGNDWAFYQSLNKIIDTLHLLPPVKSNGENSYNKNNHMSN